MQASVNLEPVEPQGQTGEQLLSMIVTGNSHITMNIIVVLIY